MRIKKVTLYFVTMFILTYPIRQVYSDPIAVPVSTYFDTDLDGWTFFNENDQQITWSLTEGNPPGAVLFTDMVDAESGTIIAPSKFLGDWSELDQKGFLSYDHRIVDEGCNPALEPDSDYHVDISGPDGSASYIQPLATDPFNWFTVTVPIDESSWTLNSGTWSGLIADVTKLSIRIEVVHNNICEPNNEQDAIDNVALVDSRSLGGAVIGMTPTNVLCWNLTTGGSVSFQTSNSSWDCEAAGLSVNTGDRVFTGAEGIAE